MSTSTIERVIDIVRDASCSDKPIAPETSLRKELGMDELAIVGLVLELEEVFGIEIDDLDVAALGDTSSSIAARLAEEYKI